MKKILAMAAIAVGIVVGAGSASASVYPPESPTLTHPATVSVNASFDVVGSDLPPGDTVTLVWLGKTYTEVPVPPVGTLPPRNATVTFNLEAPATAGPQPISAYTVSGWTYEGTINVVAVNPPKPPANKPGVRLPATGSDLVMPGVGFGLAAVAGGLSLLFVSRRRRSASA